jgi:hypothetical protein
MATARVTIIDDLRDQTQWFVIAEAVHAEAEPSRGPDQRLGSLDYAAWHAHLSGSRRWVPEGDNALRM